MSIVAAATVIRSFFMMLLLSVVAPYRTNARAGVGVATLQNI
jgi:hypothetical protein